MARVYATADDLIAWVDDYPPANAVSLLTRASLDVDTALVGVCYATDDDGLPTDTAVAQALNDAVCAQVASWVSAAQAAAMQGPRETWPRLATLRVDPPAVVAGCTCRELCADARHTLQLAGLSPVHPRVFG